MDSDHITIREAAERAGISRGTVSRWLREGRITGTRQARSVWIHARELSRALARVCAYCRAPFESTDPRREYCSQSCARRAGDRRAKDARAAEGEPRGRPPLPREPIHKAEIPPEIAERLAPILRGPPISRKD